MKLLYRLEAVSGGIYTYARHQIEALAKAGVAVTVLCRKGTDARDFPKARVLTLLPGSEPPVSLRRPYGYVMDAKKGIEIICREAERSYDFVLLDCLREYLAPFWIRPLRRLLKSGQRIGIMNHDPSRDFTFGPIQWHHYSLGCVYRSVSDIFVHGDTEMTAWSARYGNRIHQLPHGPLGYPSEKWSRESMRKRYGFENDDVVILSFGQIRDGKQLDKLIRAIRCLPEYVKLLVAGRVESASQRGMPYYLKLILYSGVVERVVWDNRYLADEELWGLFKCSDIVATLYTEKFVSSSGVMSSAVACHRPVIASCGEGPLKRAMIDYPIGEWVQPGDLNAMTRALRKMVSGRGHYAFENYLRDHSWEQNAQRVVMAAKESHAGDFSF